jgi:hypothetical protein
MGVNTWSLHRLTPPWREPASIYLHIRDNPNNPDLPDEQRDPNQIKFAAGAYDGVMGHHVDSEKELTERVDQLEKPLQALLQEATDQNLKDLYTAVLAERMMPIADELQQRVAAKLTEPSIGRVATVGRYFAAGADQREATKFGILLLGVAAADADIKLLETLATHDEFTLFAAVSLTRLVDDPEQCLWRVAQKVHGWGRVHLVERLNGSTNPDIQSWMLRDGFQNGVMDQYLAAICARTGKLHEVLQKPTVDKPLLDSASGIIDALLANGPSENMDDYEHSAEVLQAYVNHVAKTADLDLRHMVTVMNILRYLIEVRRDSKFIHGWTKDLAERMYAQCEAITQEKRWRSLIARGLKSSDESVFYTANTAARDLAMDTWAVHFKRIQKDPLKASWFGLMEQTDGSRIDEVIDLAISSLPLDKIASGPDNALGFGPGFAAHTALDYVLQLIRGFPGRGWPLIRAGLQSPVTRNRNMAFNAFSSWPREQWPADAYALLQQASRLEPNEDLKQRLSEAVKVQ